MNDLIFTGDFVCHAVGSDLEKLGKVGHNRAFLNRQDAEDGKRTKHRVRFHDVRCHVENVGVGAPASGRS
ncbi:hypothetical protein PsorP6_015569 [Peronosclerospora sorghi]|uniref:Uncharacterized protein n=1 Tax=Peronosclerospora sorghi TaxID=230839 RepID=A0ACC0WPH3_9STRA|nr:hypothetical protein PsorP6_015569 [Peronosclerospora sorghi]